MVLILIYLVKNLYIWFLAVIFISVLLTEVSELIVFCCNSLNYLCINTLNNLIVMCIDAGLFYMLRRLLSLLSTISSWPLILLTALLCLRESRPSRQLQMRKYWSWHCSCTAVGHWLGWQMLTQFLQDMFSHLRCNKGHSANIIPVPLNL